MARYLNTSATNYFLEALIKSARDRLILISPILKLNDRIRELLEDKNRQKIDIRIVYTRNELQPEEISWLQKLSCLRTSFCEKLHARCYLNEEMCIVSSLNLHEFSQVNHNEMGVLFSRAEDSDSYQEACDEAQWIIRMSDEVRISLEKVPKKPETRKESESPLEKLTSSRLAKKHGLFKTSDLMDLLVVKEYLELRGGKHYLTDKGRAVGGEYRLSPKFGPYFLWSENLNL